MTARNPEGRCQRCLILPRLERYRQTYEETMAGQQPACSPCPVCGWSPLAIVEIVVHTREEVAGLKQLMTAPRSGWAWPQ